MTSSSSSPSQRLGRGLAIALSVCLVFILVGLAAWSHWHDRVWTYLKSDHFRAAIGEETSRGLKVEGEYQPFTFDGLTASSALFDSKGRPGEAIAGMRAETITARFNPWGLFLRRWQVDRITIEHSTLELRRPDDAAKIPLEQKKKPWYAFLMPQRFYLKEVVSPDAEILWKVHGELSGIYQLHLQITPYGKKDWRFRGKDGLLKMPQIPPLRVAAMSIVVTKPYLYTESATLTPDLDHDPGSIKLHGQAGLQPTDQQITNSAELEQMPLTPWLPPAWQKRLEGRLSGPIEWDAPHGLSLDGSEGHGSLHLTEGILSSLPALDTLALLTHNAAFRAVHFTFSCDWDWQAPHLRIDHLKIEAPDLFTLEGNLALDDDLLSGQFHLGIAPENLNWLPPKGRALFVAEEGSRYHWAPIALSGTAQKPHESLGPQLKSTILGSPETLLKIGLDEVELFFGKEEH